jgi:hypothetical protein
MSTTPGLAALIGQLRTDSALQASFATNPSAAIVGFEMTGHERHAVVTRDADDLVAIGAVSSASELPGVLRPAPAPAPGVFDRLLQLRLRIQRLIRFARPPVDPPRPDPPRGP